MKDKQEVALLLLPVMRGDIFQDMAALWGYNRYSGKIVLKTDHPVTLQDPFRQFWHLGLYGPLKVRLAPVEAASDLAGAADLHRHPPGNEILEHLAQVKETLRRFAGIRTSPKN